MVGGHRCKVVTPEQKEEEEEKKSIWVMGRTFQTRLDPKYRLKWKTSKEEVANAEGINQK